jgi:hypothetical protein
VAAKAAVAARQAQAMTAPTQKTETSSTEISARRTTQRTG